MPENSNQPNPWRMAHMGLEFAGAALLLGGIGYYIDWQIGSFPIGTVIGLLIGVVGATYRFIREALAANRRNMQQYRREHAARLERDAPPRHSSHDEKPGGAAPTERPDAEKDRSP